MTALTPEQVLALVPQQDPFRFIDEILELDENHIVSTVRFSPELDFVVPPAELAPYLARVNRLLGRCNCPPLTREQLLPGVHQLKALVDLCHLHGLAVEFGGRVVLRAPGLDHDVELGPA